MHSLCNRLLPQISSESIRGNTLSIEEWRLHPGPNINMQSEISIMKGLCCISITMISLKKRWNQKFPSYRDLNVFSLYGEKEKKNVAFLKKKYLPILNRRYRIFFDTPSPHIDPCRQFADPSPPKPCRRLLWTAPNLTRSLVSF